MRRNSFKAIDVLPDGLSADLEMVVRGDRNRYRMIEFPIAEQPRLVGVTHFKAFHTGRQLLAFIVRELKRSS